MEILQTFLNSRYSVVIGFGVGLGLVLPRIHNHTLLNVLSQTVKLIQTRELADLVLELNKVYDEERNSWYNLLGRYTIEIRTSSPEPTQDRYREIAKSCLENESQVRETAVVMANIQRTWWKRSTDAKLWPWTRLGYAFVATKTRWQSNDANLSAGAFYDMYLDTRGKSTRYEEDEAIQISWEDL